ncbi:MAG: chromate transporter [Cyclobacteriaceae bacterium]|jgi:chromate transporter
MFKKVRYYIFLRDVAILTISAFGGPQAHFGMLLDLMVKKRGYLDEKELIELHALCQILPGPTSTQTLTAIGFKIGGPPLAYLTLLVWLTPAFLIMTFAGIAITVFNEDQISLEFTKYVHPIAVGIVGYSAFTIIKKVVKGPLAVVLMIASAVISFYIQTPYVFPVLLILGGGVSAFNFRKQPREEKGKLNINWANFILWAGVFLFAVTLGGVTNSLGVRIFENFYRNGSLIFGGGQVLIPLMYTEFVEFKGYLTSEEFLSGFALVQALPGPVFSFSAFIGAISLKDFGVYTQIFGAIMAALGVFLPGTFLIFFVIRFWEELKKYRIIRASIDGVSAVSSGMILAATFLLFLPLQSESINYVIMPATFLILAFTKIPTPILILVGLVAGVLI